MDGLCQLNAPKDRMYQIFVRVIFIQAPERSFLYEGRCAGEYLGLSLGPVAGQVENIYACLHIHDHQSTHLPFNYT